VKIADLNTDGKPDIVVANYGSNSIRTYENQGEFNFTQISNITVGTNPVNLAIADIDGDGDLDILVANFTSANISILLGNGTMSYSVSSNLSTGANPHHISLVNYRGEIAGDRPVDLVLTRRVGTTGKVDIYHFDSPSYSGAADLTLDAGNLSFMTIPVNLGGDALMPDFMTINFNSGSVTIHEAN
jgi:hypothetical protein